MRPQRILSTLAIVLFAFTVAALDVQEDLAEAVVPEGEFGLVQAMNDEVHGKDVIVSPVLMLQAAKTLLELSEASSTPLPASCPDMLEYVHTNVTTMMIPLQRMPDKVARDEALQSLKKLKLEVEEHCKHHDEREAQERADEAEVEARKMVGYPTRPITQNDTRSSFIETMDTNEDKELHGLHQDLQGIIKKHKIDTTKARQLSPVERNKLVSQFFAHIAMGKHLLSHEELIEQESGRSATFATKCFQGIYSVAPPDFCWKGKTHNHEFPTSCADGWHHWGAECFKNCRPGYNWVAGGTCWEPCKDGYTGLGVLCTKPLLQFHTRDHYWTDRDTHFSDIAQCNHADQYKSGAMCYKKCSTYGETPDSLINCGWDACSSDVMGCASTIINMVIEIISSIVDIAGMFATLGASAAATPGRKALTGILKEASQAVIKRVGKQGFGDRAKRAARGLYRSGKNMFSEAATKMASTSLKGFTKTYIRDAAKDGMTETMFTTICNEISKATYDGIRGEPAGNFDYSTLDLTGIYSTVQECSGGKGGTMACKAAIVGTVGTFDPTGLMGVAAAFMHEDCQLPTVPEDPWVSASIPDYLGCFQDNAARDLQFGPKNYTYTAKSCMAACKTYKFVSLQNGGECFCDDEYSTPPSEYPEIAIGSCDKKGVGMGGPYSNAVYKNTDYAPIPDYLGCFQDNAARDLKFGPKNYGYTAKSCMAACKTYKFVALQNGGECFCDDEYSTPPSEYPKIANGRCDEKVVGMGGTYANAVYKNVEKQNNKK